MRFSRVFATLFLTVLGLFAGVIILARETAPQNFALLVTDPEGHQCAEPCLLGIHPGDTNLSQAIHLLETHPLTRDLVRRKAVNSTLFVGSGFQVGVHGTSRIPLQLVTVQFQPSLEFRSTIEPSAIHTASLGEVLAVLGTPTRIALSRDGQGFVTRTDYDRLHLSIFFRRSSASRLNPEDRMLYMIMTIGSPPLIKGQSWRGFTSIFRYSETS